MLRGSRERQLCCFTLPPHVCVHWQQQEQKHHSVKCSRPVCVSKLCWVCTVGTVAVLLELGHSLAVQACTHSYSLVIFGIKNFLFVSIAEVNAKPNGLVRIFFLYGKKILYQNHCWPNHIWCYSTFSPALLVHLHFYLLKRSWSPYEHLGWIVVVNY